MSIHLHRGKGVDALVGVGLACLVLANLSRFVLHPTAQFSRDAVDAAVGFLFGVSIGVTFLGFWRTARRHRGQECDPAAR